MPGAEIDLSELEIIGYANVLAENTRPSIVPPIFQSKANPESIFVPPYTFRNGRLCDATEISPSELASLAHRREVTAFDAPRSAEKDYELWVDLEGQHHYETRRNARRALDAIAKESLAKALHELRYSQLESADRHSSVALLAAPKNMEALAIKIAIAEIKGSLDRKALLRESIRSFDLPSIEARVSDLCGEYCAAGGTKTPKAPIMGGMARIRSMQAA